MEGNKGPNWHAGLQYPRYLDTRFFTAHSGSKSLRAFQTEQILETWAHFCKHNRKHRLNPLGSQHSVCGYHRSAAGFRLKRPYRHGEAFLAYVQGQAGGTTWRGDLG